MGISQNFWNYTKKWSVYGTSRLNFIKTYTADPELRKYSFRNGNRWSNATTDIKNKIKNIRTTYKLELNKILKASKSGAGIDDLYKPKLFWSAAQADAFLRGVSTARESQSNLILKNTPVEDHFDLSSPNPDSDPDALILKPDELPNLQDQNHEDIIATPTTSKSKQGKTTVKRKVTSQSIPPKKKQKLDDSVEQALDKLQAISDQCKEPEDDEFDLFGKSIACQLKKMPLEMALMCQEKLLSVIRRERLQQITSRPSLQLSNSSVYSVARSSNPNSPPFQQYIIPTEFSPGGTTHVYYSSFNPNSPRLEQHTDSQDILSQALMDI